jgi:hypothetical protein
MIKLVPLSVCVLQLLVGCAHPVAMGARGITGGSDASEAKVTDIITAALDAEAQGHRSDSLYASSAVIVVNGRTRSFSPLFAGIGTGGEVAITSSQLQIRTGIAWGLVNYRWETRDNVAREGQATFVLAETGNGRWQIQHVHSSSPR